ncbi:hypothetical protein BH23ACT1_BH23ACT1_07550 [soil metagenome]
MGARGLYCAIVARLGGLPRYQRSALIAQAAEALATEVAERGKRVVLVVDEGQLLDASQLEELRLLTGSDMDSRSFTCLLVGQPTLRRCIKLGAFAALDQRIALRYAMPGMDLAETGEYVAHHLKLAGRADTLFSDDAVALVHQVSRGLPRAVNNLAVQSLVAAFADNKSIVDESSARAAVTEVTAE